MRFGALLRFLLLPGLLPLFTGPLREAGKGAGLVAVVWGGLWRRARGGGTQARGVKEVKGRWRSAWMVLGVAVAGLGAGSLLAGVLALLSRGALGQTFDENLFAEADEGTRSLLGFLSDFDISEHTALGDMFFVYNGGLLLVAGGLLIYHTVGGTVETAREGRLGFGGWEIVRIVWAVALMAPLPGGMNGAQHLVVGIANLGGDFAHAIWKPFSEEALGKGTAIVPRPREGAWRSSVARVLIAEVCRYVSNEVARRAGDEPYVLVKRSETKVGGRPRPKAGAPAPGEQVLSYDGKGRGMPRALCGAVHYTGVGLGEPSERAAAQAHREALEAVRPGLRRVAAALGARFVPGSAAFGTGLPDIEGALDAAGIAARYAVVLDRWLGQAAEVERSALERVVAQDVQEASWLSAASFFNTIAHRSGRFLAGVHNSPEVALPAPELVKWVPAADAAVKAVTVGLSGSRRYPPALSSSAIGAAEGGVVMSGEGLMDGILDFIDLESVMVADSGNPIADLAAMGHNLIYSSIGAMTLLTGAAVGSGFFEHVGWDVFESSWQVMDSFVSTILSTMLIAGIVLAYVLPALPYIRFLFGIVGWVVSVVVALLAVTVFAAAHVTRGDGDRLTTEATRQGWLFLPGLFLRPALMLFGLILGYFVFLAGVTLFNQTWLPQMRDASASGGLGLIGAVTMLAIYTIVCFVLMNSSFKLIELLPAGALEWIGGRGGADGGDAEHTGAVAVGGIGRMGGLRVARGGGKVGARAGVTKQSPPAAGSSPAAGGSSS